MSPTNSSPTPPIRIPMDRFYEALAELLAVEGPFTSFYLPVHDDQARQASLDALTLAEGLTPLHQSFGESLLASELETDDAMVVGLISADGTSFVQSFPEGPGEPLITTASLPRLSPVIEAEQRLRHHMLVVVSDEGIEALTFPRHGAATLHHAEPGDLAHTASLISQVARHTETPLVLLASGSHDAEELRSLIISSLPVETRVEVVDADQPAAVLADRAVAEVATVRAEASVQSIRRWKFERSHGLTASGTRSALTQLRTDEARMLLVHDDPDDVRQAWFGKDPTVIALDLEDGRTMADPSTLKPGRFVDVLLRSALLRHISVSVVPDLPAETLPDGVGVICSSKVD